jgi:hypothetical protein
MKHCMHIEVRLHLRGNSRYENANSHWWFVMCWI